MKLLFKNLLFTLLVPGTVAGLLPFLLSRGASPADIAAAVLLISGCQDHQLSIDGPDNGAFTGALLEVWDGGRFEGTYQDFHAAIRAELPRTQSPNLMLMGAAAPALAREQPFRV